MILISGAKICVLILQLYLEMLSGYTEGKFQEKFGIYHFILLPFHPFHPDFSGKIQPQLESYFKEVTKY
jgi:hypothetical protein